MSKTSKDFLVKVNAAMDRQVCLVVKYSNQLRLVEPVAICGGNSVVEADRVLVKQITDDGTQFRTFLLESIESVSLTDRAISKETLTTKANPGLRVIRNIQ